jgi:hypothetical protein
MPFHITVHSKPDLEMRAASFGQGELGFVVGTWFDLHSSAQVEGEPELMAAKFVGDISMRPGAAPDQVAERLSELLSTMLDRPIRLQFRNVEREMLVVRGNCSRQSDAHSAILVMGDPPRPSNRITVSYTLRQVLASVASRMKLQIVDEAVDSDSIKVRYTSDSMPIASEQIDSVLQYLCAETSLTFERQVRPARILFVEQGAEPSR